MDDINDNIDNFDSPRARREMRHRHALLGNHMMALAVRGLQELEQKAQLNMTAEEVRRLYDPKGVCCTRETFAAWLSGGMPSAKALVLQQDGGLRGI